MTIFGILWLCIILWDFIKKPVTNTFFLMIFFMTFQSTNVIYVNGSGIGPGVLTSLVFILKIFFMQKMKIRKIVHSVTIFAVALLILLIAYISLILNDVLRENILLFFQITVYVFCFISIQFIKTDITADWMYQSIRKIIIFHVAFSIIQILTTINILPIRFILTIFFYNDPSTDIVFHRAYYARVMSTFMEPSYYAGFIVGAFYFLLIQKDKLFQNKILLVMIAIEILLTQSSTAYGALLIIGIVLILFSNSFTLKQKIIICAVGMITALVLYFGFYSLLDKVIFSKNLTGSYTTRTRYNSTAWKAFLTSPLLGIGYKNCRGSSIIYSLLGQIGIIGTSVYLLFNVVIQSTIKAGSKNMKDLLTASKFGVLTTMICQIIACPDLDLCTYWIWLYIFSFVIRITEQDFVDCGYNTRKISVRVESKYN